jgi:hypothetical protein
MLRNPQIAMMVAGLENFRQTRYMVSPGAIQTSQSRGFASGGYTTGTNSNPYTGKNGSMENPLVFSANEKQQLEILSALAIAVSDLQKWNPSISIEAYERKREQYRKTINSGLKGLP